jgi:hypothetical protein
VRSEAELHAFFRDELLPRVRAWKRMTRIRPVGLLDAAVLALAAAACLWLRRLEPAWIGAGYAALRVAGDVSRVRTAFKREVLAPLFEFALPGVRYDPAARIDGATVEGSGLFPESWTSDSGEDYVAGTLGETAFRLSELRLLRRQRKNRQTVVFHGLFFVADFNKSFRGRTYLLPDVAERVFGTLGRSLQALPRFDGTELVELEDPDFEKRFVCYASDPIEARYVLSTSLLRRLLGLAERASGSLRVSFLDERLYLAMPVGDLFPAAFFASSVDEEALHARVRELYAVVGLVEELGLNTRIWSKGGLAANDPPRRSSPPRAASPPDARGPRA